VPQLHEDIVAGPHFIRLYNINLSQVHPDIGSLQTRVVQES